MDNSQEETETLLCPQCGYLVDPTKDLSLKEESSVHTDTMTLIEGRTPTSEEIQFTLGPYQILKSIGKGGMGEVFLAYDTICGRQVALKKIRADLKKHPFLYERFLKEARITSQLAHPAIVPIYAIHSEGPLIYYTMPFLRGETLKEILRKVRRNEKQGIKSEAHTGSIPALVRLFISVCQAVAYAHAKGVLHRDLKPENIIVGTFGQVHLLDWGLAQLTHPNGLQGDDNDLEEEETSPTEFTRAGKVVGTISYMAPERGLGLPANAQTEIYALGVILYQLLTLKKPFQRGSIEEFRKHMTKEVYRAPSEVSPYRDVPRLLSRVTKKCLEVNPKERYQTLEELIYDLENYIEGRAEWYEMRQLRIDCKEDWEFQENVLLADHIAITGGADVADWVSLMISKTSFSENTKIEARVRIKDSGHGLGLMLSIPERAERSHLNDGYCLWLGSDLNKSTKLLRKTVEVVHASDLYLKRNVWYTIKIEKIDHNLYFYLDHTLQFSYISQIPLVGTHVGLLSRDADFEIEDFTVYSSGQNIMVNCLAVPDAFLAHKDYTTALNEYRRIGYSFPGRAEGREAMFRAGITILEEARAQKGKKRQEKLFDLALEEFEKLHSTPGALLEYLGKAFVYRAMEEFEEEIKCFELAFRRYPHHPLLPLLQEHSISRMHESSRFRRKTAYLFVLLAVRFLSKRVQNPSEQRLFSSLQRHWEPLPFMEDDPTTLTHKSLQLLAFAIPLSFWVGRTYILEEIIGKLLEVDPLPQALIGNALFSLVELGKWEQAEEILQKIDSALKNSTSLKEQKRTLSPLIVCYREGIEVAVKRLSQGKFRFETFSEERMLIHLIEYALDQKNTACAHKLLKAFDQSNATSEEFVRRIDCLKIWTALLDEDWDQVGAYLEEIPWEDLHEERDLLFCLYGIWLHHTEGKEIATIHFSGVLETRHPRSWTLLAHYVNGKIDENHTWYKRAFAWEKQQYHRQVALYHKCCK